jgi:WD40 repeat protein
MGADPRVAELLMRWEDERDQGRPVPVEELCRDCPELLDELRRRVRALEAMQPLLREPGPSTYPETLAAEGPERPGGPPGPVAAIPGYEIERELGRGGMGVVYLARQTSLGRQVALKMILSGPFTSEQQRQRFHAEAEAAASVQHPNIVQVFDVGEIDGRAYCAMEYVEGRNLAEALDGKPCPPREAAELVATLAEAVQAAHARGVIHRDLKPANVLLATTETAKPQAEEGKRPPAAACGLALPKITDFGLAKRLESGQGLTETGAVMGTPSYMAPEQAQGKKDVGPLADVYSLGAILYECLTGRPPLLGATALETLTQVVASDPLPPRSLQPGVPRDLDTICLKCLQKPQHRRYASAQALAEDLRRYLAGEPIRARPVGATERLARWCRKRPAVAGLTAALALLLVVVAVGASIGNVRLRRALDSEAREHQEAVTQREAAVAEATRSRRLLYAADMRFAADTWQGERGSPRRVGEVLAAWDTGEGEDLREFAWRYLWGQVYGQPGTVRGHAGPVRRGAWLADGRLVTVDGQDVLRCWAPGEKLPPGAPLRKGGPAHVELSADGSVVAFLTGAGGLRLVDTATAKTLHDLAIPGGEAATVLLAPEGRRVLARAADGNAWLWETTSGRLLRTFTRVPPLSRRAAALAPGGLVVGANAGTAGEKAVLLGLPKHGRRGPLHAAFTLTCLAFAPDGQALAGGNLIGQLYLWSPNPFRQQRRLTAHFGAVSCLAFSRDGKALASGSQEGAVAVNDVSDEAVPFRARGHLAPVTFVALAADRKRLASGDADGTVRLWQVGRPPGPQSLPSGTARIMHLTCSPDGKWLAAAQGPSARLWDAGTGKSARAIPLPPGGDARALRVAFAPDSKLLAVGSASGAVYLWGVEAGKFLRALDDRPALERLKKPCVTALAFSPDGSRLVVGHGSLNVALPDHDQIAQVWDVGAGKVLHTLPHRNTVYSLAFSPAGGLLISGCGDRKVRAWDTATWRVTREWAVDTRVWCSALSPGGDLVAAGQNDGTISVWEVGSGKLAWQAREHARRVAEVAFSPDGKTLASCGEDGSVRLWHVISGRGLLAWHASGDHVWSLAFSPDGTALAAGDRVGRVRVWRAPSFERVAALRREGVASPGKK